MLLITLLLVTFGFIEDKVRGSVISSFLVTYVLLGGVAGYYSARIYKMLSVITFSFFYNKNS
jgi:hypothetical protein